MKTYHIEFSRVERDSPRMVATAITIGSEIISQNTEKMDVSLCTHPLYPKLEAYVLANPSGKNDR